MTVGIPERLLTLDGLPVKPELAIGEKLLILWAESTIASTDIGSIGLDCMGGGLGLGLGTPAKIIT